MADNAEQVSAVDEPQVEQAPAVDVATDAPQAENPPGGTENIVDEEEDAKSKLVTLADLTAKGTTLYVHKNYEEAAEFFARASELQAELNGETAPENADILFHYGRSLFRVGQSKSDVLGGAASNEKKPAASANSSSKATTAPAGPSTPSASESNPKSDTTAAIPEAKKLLFQFTGDENFDDSDDDDQEPEGEPEEEDDDLATAFEILDLARVCYLKQLEALEAESKGKETVAEMSPKERHIKERLADTHDALAEISLENERYPAAIEDGRVWLKYAAELYPEDSEIIAEAHFKLSLALEFASVTVSDDEGQNAKREEVDQTLRDEAVKEMELAIKSSQLKLQNKEVEVATMASPEDNELTRKAIGEMKEVIADMEQRLVDLRKGPIDANELLGGPQGNALGGVFGAVLGESAAQTSARVEEAKKGAVDLTSMVRKRTKPEAETLSASNGKRKADEPAETGGESPKKVKVDEE